MLQINNLEVSYSGNSIFRNVSLNLKSGQIVGLLGANGAGKTSLLRAAAGIIEPSSGLVLLDKGPVRKIPRKILAQYVIYVPQNALRPKGLCLHDMILQGRFPWLPFSGLYAQTDIACCDRALRHAELSHMAQKDVATLSGGEWQRALLARALCQADGSKQAAFLLDEITSGLDPARAIAIFTLLSQLKKAGFAILASLHDCNMAAMFATHIIALKNGKMLFYGEMKDVFTAKNISLLYDMEMDSFTHPDLGCPQFYPRFKSAPSGTGGANPM